MPHQLCELAQACAAAVGMALRPEAAIINFYRPGGVMGGHKVSRRRNSLAHAGHQLRLDCHSLCVQGNVSRPVT